MPLINRAIGASIALPSYTGTHTIYGNWRKGWIEMRTSGTLTIPKMFRKRFDIYLLEDGESGATGRVIENSTLGDDGNYLYYWDVTPGNGGKGGDWMEKYAIPLSGAYQVAIGSVSTLGTYTTEGASNGAPGGTITEFRRVSGNSSTIVNTSPTTTNASNGRIPFTGHGTLTSGRAALALGPGGGYGGLRYTDSTRYAYNFSPGGEYGGSADANGKGAANSGAGGNGGTVHTGSSNTQTGGAGGSGIAIVRWGY